MIDLSCLKTEFVRRFYVSKLPVSLNYTANGTINSMMAFLNKESDSLELCAKCFNEETFVLNIRDFGTVKRNNINLEISQSEFEVIYALSKPKVIHLKEYLLKDSNEKKIVLIQYENMFEPIWIVEYYGSDISDANSYKPDDWFNNEVTNDYRYSPIFLSINRKIIGEKIMK